MTGIPTATVADLDEDYIAKMEDVLEVYERPYNPQELVVCLDEKPITLHADVRPASPPKPGQEARRDNEIRTLRHGQCLLRSRTESGSPFHVPYARSFRL
jgi:hypothetical protein